MGRDGAGGRRHGRWSTLARRQGSTRRRRPPANQKPWHPDALPRAPDRGAIQFLRPRVLIGCRVPLLRLPSCPTPALQGSRATRGSLISSPANAPSLPAPASPHRLVQRPLALNLLNPKCHLSLIEPLLPRIVPNLLAQCTPPPIKLSDVPSVLARHPQLKMSHIAL